MYLRMFEGSDVSKDEEEDSGVSKDFEGFPRG